MLMAHGFLRRVFEVFERCRTPIDVVSTSEVSISVTIDDASRLEKLVEELSAFADVRVEHDMAILCAVGDGLRRDPRLATRILGSLEHFPLRMVSQAASRRNVTVVLQDAVAAAAMNHLHDRVLRARRRRPTEVARPGVVSASLLIVGRGRMGRLVEALAPDYGFDVAGTVDIDNAGQPESWPQADVAIDFSLADAVPENFPRLAARGMNIVIGATGWQAHEAAAARRGGGARHRRGGGAEFRDRREPVPGAGRARRGAVARPAGVRRLAARAAPRGEARRAVGHRAGDRGGDARAAATRIRSTCRRRAPDRFPARTRSGSTRRRKRSR